MFSRRPVPQHNRGRVPSGPAASGPAPPTTPLTIFGSKVVQWCRADLGISVGTGVSAWADQSSNAHDYAQGTGAAQPAYTASEATLNNQPMMTFDGTDDALINATVPFSAQPQVVILIMRQNMWTSGRVFCSTDSLASTCGLIQGVASPGFRQINTSQVNLNSALAIGAWGRVQAHFTGTVADTVKAIATAVTGAMAGTSTGTGFRLGRQGGAATAYSGVSLAEVVLLNAVPSAGEDTAMDAYVTARYGAGLV